MPTYQWKRLTHIDLTKRGGDRLRRFIDMIENGDEFLTQKGVIVIDPDEAIRLREEAWRPGYRTKLTIVKNKRKPYPIGEIQYPTQFLKTPEFGGRGTGSATSKEDFELISLKKQIQD